jgi:signal transduction histidine kinase/HAMP domain-containing protein
MMSKFKLSISAKLLIAFLALGAIIAVQGLYGYRLVEKAGAMVVDTFDGPLMAVNYARAANYDFAQIELALQQRATAKPSDRVALDAAIDDLTATFRADLSVAEERSAEPDERREIGVIKSLFAHWLIARHAGSSAEMGVLSDKICHAFDLLIEFNTDHSFMSRKEAAATVVEFRNVLAGGLFGAVLFAVLISVLLARQIGRPLSQAASVANRIAAGEFETPIPAAGSDETGTLLRSMKVMQDNIRVMVEREKARATSAEMRLADALETSDEGVMLVGSDDRLVMANSRLASFFPGAEESFRPGASFNRLSDVLSASFVEPHGGDSSDKSTQLPGEHLLPDGRWIRISISPTSDDGKIVFVIDITQIKEREEGYKLAKHEAEAANAAKSRFLANMSHELRTPLNAVIGFSEIIQDELFGKLGSPRYVEYAGDILRSGRHLLSVINSVLDLSKAEAGKLTLHTGDVDLRDVLRDCIKMVAPQCAHAGLVLNVGAFAEPLPVSGDEAKLRQIFLNVLSNAVKFTERGGVVSLNASRSDGEIVVWVRDTGIGMSDEDIQVALTPFGQVDNRLERKYEGTGLGLPITKSFVELHGGVLQIESVRGRGTTVRVRFPSRATTAAELAVA